jgi:hypothetical protein
MPRREPLQALFEPVKVYVPYNEENDCGFNKDTHGNTLMMNLDGHLRNYHGTNNLFYGWQAYFDIKDGLPKPDPETAPMSSVFWRMAMDRRPELFEVMDQAAENEAELTEALNDFHMLARARQIGRIGIEHYQEEQRAKLTKATVFLVRTASEPSDRRVVEKRQAYYMSQSLDPIFTAADQQGRREEIKPEAWCT